jgi:hypothetical protein
MNLLTLTIYLVHAGILTSGLLLVRRLHRQGRLEQALRHRRVLGGSAVALAALMLAIAEPLRGVFQDFVDAYYSGGAHLLSGAWNVGDMFRNDVHGFVNVPIVAVLFVPFAVVPSRVAALIFFGLGVAAVVATWRLLVRIGRLDGYLATVVALLMLCNGPLMNSLKEGNTSHFALFAMAWALLALRENKQYAAGLLIGFATIFKLPLVVYGAWSLVRGRFRAVLGGATVIAATAGASLLLFGIDAHVTWYERFVVSSSRAPLAAFNVQSVPAFLARFTRASEVLCSWEGVSLAPRARLFSSLVSLTLVAGCVVAALRPRMRRGGTKPTQFELELEFAMVGMLACCTSPLAWSHYYCWALLPIALMLSPEGIMRRLSSRSPIKLLWFAAIALVSLPVAWPWCKPTGPLAMLYTLFTSHYLLGGILLLMLLAFQRAAGDPKAHAEGAR